MISRKDERIITHLRKNARKKITKIAEEVGIPVTTVYDRVRAHEHTGLLKRHVALLDFHKLGLHSQIHMAVKADKSMKDDLERFLLDHPNVNSLYRINFGYTYLLEAAFSNQGDTERFIEEMERRGVKETNVYNIIEELKRETIMSEA